MYTKYKQIDSNMFVAYTDKDEEITYRVKDNITDLDIFEYIFTENEYEHWETKLSELINDKKQMNIKLFSLRNNKKAIKKINYEINNAYEELSKLSKRLELIKENLSLTELYKTKKVRKLTK